MKAQKSASAHLWALPSFPKLPASEMLNPVRGFNLLWFSVARTVVGGGGGGGGRGGGGRFCCMILKLRFAACFFSCVLLHVTLVTFCCMLL